MVEIFINAPFKYLFHGRTKYANSGDTITFDLSKSSHREELRYLLSPTFGFRKFIRADDNIIRLLNSNDEDELSARYTSISESPASFIHPAQEPDENPFVPQYSQSITDTSFTQPQHNVPVYLEELPPLSTTEDLPRVDAENNEPDDYSLNEEVEKRYEELNATHWSKVKAMAEGKGMEYTSKQEVVEAIISSEFNISKETLNGILA